MRQILIIGILLFYLPVLHAIPQKNISPGIEFSQKSTTTKRNLEPGFSKKIIDKSSGLILTAFNQYSLDLFIKIDQICKRKGLQARVMYRIRKIIPVEAVIRDVIDWGKKKGMAAHTILDMQASVRKLYRFGGTEKEYRDLIYSECLLEGLDHYREKQ